MAAQFTRLEFRAVPPSTTAPLAQAGTLVGAIEWPKALAAAGLGFVIGNLLAERTGSEVEARALITRGYGAVVSSPEHPVGSVLAAERPRFLAYRAFFPPEPDETLASTLDLEDLVADFSMILRAIRELPEALDVVLLLS